jgi:hypothetical protein
MRSLGVVVEAGVGRPRGAVRLRRSGGRGGRLRRLDQLTLPLGEVLALERVDLEAIEQRGQVHRQLGRVGVGEAAQEVGRQRRLVLAERLRDLARWLVLEFGEVRVGELGDHVAVDDLVPLVLGEDLRLGRALAGDGRDVTD